MRRLRARFAPQGMLHYGLGKWYPGEAMPRWAFGLYWRRDGKPIWRDAALIAREGEPRTATAEDAQRFAEAVAEDLGIAAERVQAAYEDPAHWMLEEGKLPANVDVPIRNCSMPPRAPAWCAPSSAGSARRPDTCCRCAAHGERPGSAKPGRRGASNCFCCPAICRWARALPLASLPRVEPADYPIVTPSDRWGHLPCPIRSRRARARTRSCARRSRSSRATDGSTCSCPMSARSRIISPSSRRSKAAAGKLRLPVHLEGYAPPDDPRLDFIRVTPDPGVIEVNLHAARKLARTVSNRARPLRGRARLPPRQLRNSCATAARPAPAAAVTSWSAARRPRKARSCAVRTCSRASCSTGSATRPSPICSPACSSGRPASRRASTRRATKRSTSSRSRSRRCPRPAKRRTPVARRPAVPQSAGRRHRQHPSRRDLHRQAVLARQSDRPARPGRIPRLRDGARTRA